MARKKSPIRSMLSGRRLRWSLFRALGAIMPGAVRRLSFSLASVRAVDCAAQVEENVREEARLHVSPQEISDILTPAAANDTGDASGNLTGTAIETRQAALLSGCDVLGHTMTLVRSADGALVNAYGGAPNWNYSKPALLRSRPAAPGPHALIANTANYFHFLANDILPLLRWLEARPDDRLTLVAPEGLTAMAQNVLDALMRVHPGLRLKTLGRRERLTGVSARWLFMLSSNYEWAPFSRGDADRLTRLLLDHAQAEGRATRPLCERLFLDRGGAKLRRLSDGAAVRDVLARHGFVGFVADYGNHPEQVAAFAGARVVAGVHGAGLANLLFCQPGAQVIEIFPSNFIKSTYFSLSRRLGLDYSYVIGGPGDYDQTFAAGAEGLEALLAERFAVREHATASGAVG